MKPMSAAIAAGDTVVGRERTTDEALGFAATYFEAYIESRLNEEVEVDFSILGAAAYYLADNPGSAMVVARGAAPPPVALGAGLALLSYRLLLSDYEEIGRTVYGAFPDRILSAISSYLDGTGNADDALTPMVQVREEAYRSGDGRELLYADIAPAMVRKKITNSARAILPAAADLDLEIWLPALQRSRASCGRHNSVFAQLAYFGEPPPLYKCRPVRERLARPN